MCDPSFLFCARLVTCVRARTQLSGNISRFPRKSIFLLNLCWPYFISLLVLMCFIICSNRHY